jgi:glycosyltransferase involved in cell wall biosynthesis
VSGLRVALLSPCYWPEVRRGGERFVHDLAAGLLERGHRPRLIVSHPGPASRTVEEGVPVVRLPRPPERRLVRRRFESHLTHVPLAYRELARGDDDVAVAIYPTDALAAARWTRRTGRPSVLAYLGIPDRRALVDRRGRVEILRRVTRDCTAVTALSVAAADAFERWLGVDARVIAPGVDLAAFAPGPGGRAPAPTIFCAADVGEPRKRVDLLVEAFGRVRESRPDALLVLSRPRDPAAAAPAGADRPGIERATLDGLGIERPDLNGPGVEFADLDATGALADAYRSAWVTALPSFGEGFGLVLVEALACGTPVVGTDDGAIPEIVDRPEIGRLFARDDPQDLARALLEALDLSQEPGVADACRARAEDFSLDRCVDAYDALLRELA